MYWKVSSKNSSAELLAVFCDAARQNSIARLDKSHCTMLTERCISPVRGIVAALDAFIANDKLRQINDFSFTGQNLECSMLRSLASFLTNRVGVLAVSFIPLVGVYCGCGLWCESCHMARDDEFVESAISCASATRGHRCVYNGA